MRIALTSLRCVLLLLVFALPHAAKASSKAESFPHGTVRLVAENSWIEPGRSLTVGLHFSLENDWHMYWINPGDSGEPPKVAWDLPQGLIAGPLQWPAPEKLGSATVVDYGYKGEVTLLVPVQAAANLPSGQAQVLKASVRLLVCKDICVPGKAQVTLELPVKSQTPGKDSEAATILANAHARLPRPAPSGWQFAVKEEPDSFVLVGRVGERISEAYFYPADESEIKNASAQSITPEGFGFRLTLMKSDQLTKSVTRLRGVLHLTGDRAYVIDLPISPSDKRHAGG